MSRQRNAVRSVEIKLSLPQDLSAKIDILLWDAVLQKPKYGARSKLIETLLSKWCDEQEASPTPSAEPSTLLLAGLS